MSYNPIKLDSDGLEILNLTELTGGNIKLND